MRVRPATAARALGVVLLTTGTTHFVRPGFYRDLIPPALPGTASAWVYGSGVAELACAALLVVPRTRRPGGYAAAVLLVGVFPGNVWMAWDWRDRSTVEQLAAYGRLPLQVPLVLWAVYAARQANQHHGSVVLDLD
jgi:uncharacterized membrane protein